MSSKNILIVSAVFPPEPVVSANISFDIASELALNNNVTVISPYPTRPFGSDYKNLLPKSYPFKHKILNSFTSPKSNVLLRLLESFSFGKKLSKYISNNKKNIDIIYANTWPVFSQFFLLKTTNKLNIPVVLHIQDIYPESFIMKLPKIMGKIVRYLISPIDRFVLNNVHKVIAISPQMKDYLASTRNLNQSKIKVIRNWQNHDVFTNHIIQKTDRSDKFTFIYLGSISPSAGIEILIESFAYANINNSKLIIAGGGSGKNKCINLAKKYSCEIEFIEASLEDVPKIQAKADILLMPLKKGIGKTASPSKLPAYMFSKKPIIASVDIDSDSARVINEAHAGWVVEPENIGLLISAMKAASSVEKKELNLKGENGFKYAMNHFSKKKNLKKLVNVILE